MKFRLYFFQLTIIFLIAFSPCPAQQPESVIDLQNRISLLQFSDDGKLLAAETGYDFAIYKTETGKLHSKLETPSGFSANSAIFSNDGKVLITGNNDGKIRFFDTATFSLLKTFSATQWSIYALSISPDNRILAADAADGTVQLWNIKTGNKIKILGDKGQRMKFINFSPNNKFLAIITLDSELNLFDFETSKKIFSVQHSTQSPLIFCRQGKELVTTNHKVVDFLSAKNGKIIQSVEIPKEYIPFTAHQFGGYFHGQTIISEDCQTAAINDWKSKTITLLDIKSKKVKKILENSASSKGSSYIMSFSPNGEFIAAGSTSGKVKIWRLK